MYCFCCGCSITNCLRWQKLAVDFLRQFKEMSQAEIWKWILGSRQNILTYLGVKRGSVDSFGLTGEGPLSFLHRIISSVVFECKWFYVSYMNTNITSCVIYWYRHYNWLIFPYARKESNPVDVTCQQENHKAWPLNISYMCLVCVSGNWRAQ